LLAVHLLGTVHFTNICDPIKAFILAVDETGVPSLDQQLYRPTLRYMEDDLIIAMTPVQRQVYTGDSAANGLHRGWICLA
jgi:hypothetical protein